MNRYFIVEKTNPNLEHICSVCISGKCRESLDGTKMVVKLPLGYEGTPETFEGVIEYSHAEILPIMHSAEWQDEDLI